MKRIIYTLIGVMFSVGAWAQNVAKIGTTEYATLAAAFEAITDNTATTIEVLADCSGNGIIVPSERDITVNFNNHTYTVNTDVLAGSNGTKNQCFQLLRDSKVTFNNGKIVADNAAIKMIIQNYSDLTLTGMTIDAKVGSNSVNYVVSNNNGNTVFGAGTTITAKSTGVAFDVYSFKNEFNYTGANVTVDGATINGKIEVSAKNEADVANLKLNLTSGTVNGEIVMGNRSGEAAVSKSEAVTVAAPEDYKWDATGNLVPKVYVAQIGETKYETLAEAFEAITDNAATTIEVLADCSGNGIIVPSERDITVNFNNHTYTVNTDVLAGSNGTKTQGFQLLRDSKVTFNNGKIVADNAAIKMIIQNYSDLTLTGMTIDATQGTNSVNYVVSNNNGNTVFGAGTTITAKSTGVAFDVYSFKNEFNYTGANVTVDGATINGKIEVSAKNGADVDNLKLNLTSGTVNGEIVMGNRSGEAVVTKDESFAVEAPADYKWNADGKLVPKDYVAQVGDVKYESLADAIAAATEGQTVSLISDIVLDKTTITVNSDKNFILDLNGKTVSFTSGKIDNKGTLTIKSSVEGGKITRNGSGYTVSNIAGANLTLESGTIELTGAPLVNGALDNKGILTINGGEVKARRYAVYCSAGSETTIKGGSITSSEISAVYLGGGSCEITDGNFYSADGFVNVTLFKGELKAPESVTNNANATFTSAKSGYVYAIAGAISLAGNNEVITLLKDINATAATTFDNVNSITLNLNGHNITSSKTAIKVTKGKLTITGEGVVKGANPNAKSTTTDPYSAVWASGGNVIINGGTFDEGGVDGSGNSTIYANKTSVVTINGGTFKNCATYDSKLWTLNVEGGSTASIVAKGGTFHNFDPANNVNDGNSDNMGTNYVADGYISERTATSPYDIYIVKGGQWVATIADEAIKKFRYTSLDEAIDDAKAAAKDITITLLTDAETTKKTLPANVTIDANDKVLTMPLFVVLDGAAFTLPNITGAKTYKVRTATYIRTNISATVWGTVCLPFSLTSGNGADYYTYNNINGSTLTVDETTTVDPNTPVVFHKGTGDLVINEANATVSLVTPGTLVNGALVGTYSEANITADGNIYFINGNLFHQAQVSVKVPAYRAYISNNVPSGAAPRSLSIVVGGENNETGVETIAVDGADVNAVYDMAGRKMQAPRKGMSIVKLANGKTVKLFVK